MKRAHQKLSLEDHRELATHIYAIRAHLSKMLDVAGGKVSAKVIDALLSSSCLERQIIRLRMSLEETLFKELRDQASVYVYDANVDAVCQTDIRPKDTWACASWPSSPAQDSSADNPDWDTAWMRKRFGRRSTAQRSDLAEGYTANAAAVQNINDEFNVTAEPNQQLNEATGLLRMSKRSLAEIGVAKGPLHPSWNLCMEINNYLDRWGIDKTGGSPAQED